MQEEFKEDEIYIIPHNYNDNGKILGVFDKPSFYAAMFWFIPTTITLYYLPMNPNWKIYVFMLLILPPTVVMCVGIGHDPFLDFVKFFYKFNKSRRILYYEKDGICDEGEK